MKKHRSDILYCLAGLIICFGVSRLSVAVAIIIAGLFVLAIAISSAIREGKEP